MLFFKIVCDRLLIIILLVSGDVVIKILFVCLGNICRSPAAEGIFKKLVELDGLQESISCDSCGTIGSHAGQQVDQRMKDYAAKRGYELDHIARQLNVNDLKDFDRIMVMDKNNLTAVTALDFNKKYGEKIEEFAKYCSMPGVAIVPDPYYGDADGFEETLSIIEDAANGLLAELKEELGV